MDIVESNNAEENIKSKNKLIKVATESELQQILNECKNCLIIIMCSAHWCGPCKRIKPKIKELSAKYTKSVFLYIDIEKFSNDTEEKSPIDEVDSMPTFLFFINNKFIDKRSGCNASEVQKYIIKGEATILKNLADS
jgi:thioredoxin 1